MFLGLIFRSLGIGAHNRGAACARRSGGAGAARRWKKASSFRRKAAKTRHVRSPDNSKKVQEKKSSFTRELKCSSRFCTAPGTGTRLLILLEKRARACSTDQVRRRMTNVPCRAKVKGLKQFFILFFYISNFFFASHIKNISKSSHVFAFSKQFQLRFSLS
ncbi:unnamed protein product [Amoebophrya sp. A120]|nr:unnamed protein product [Amoebophrya sp. A120]|eukprot:GSA120T00014176001.1